MFEKKKMIRYIVIFSTILIFYIIIWFIKIYDNFKFEIDNRYYEFNINDLKDRWKSDNEKSVIILEANDFNGIKKSIIPVFSNLINWPGEYSFFSVNYIIIIFLIIL